MIVFFKNETDDYIILELGENSIKLNSGMKMRLENTTNRIKFNCYLNCDSEFNTMKFPKFIVLHHIFILKSFYDLLLKRDRIEINFTKKEVKGNHAETYKFLDVNGEFFEIMNKEFKVKDEEKAKLQLSDYRKRDERSSKYLKVFDVLQSIFYIGVPGSILFFGICYFANFLTALYVTVPIVIVGLIVGLLIKKILTKINNKLEKLSQDSNDLYIDTNSYFQNEYILNVIKTSK